jgi:soluble lytic murein transglycosylase-like protein
MKIQEILNEDQLDEKLRDVIAAGMIAAASLSPQALKDSPPPKPTPEQTAVWKKRQAMQEIEVMAASIQKRYKVDKVKAQEIVKLAKKYEKASFPKAVDILSVIGVESSFKPTAQSNLKNDPAVGLMQVRPKVWGLDKSDIDTPEEQIKIGADILHKYYNKLGSEDKALHAYNIGITNFKRGTGLNPKYVDKVNAEQSWYEKIMQKLQA